MTLRIAKAIISVLIWAPETFFMVFWLSSYSISRETNKPNLKKTTKTLILDPILTHLAQIWHPTNFFAGFKFF